MTHYTNEAVQPVNQLLLGVAQRLRDAGATLPAPQVGGTIESAMNHGLCIALALVEEAIAAAPQLSGNSGQLAVPDALSRSCYMMSEPHLGGYRLILGFESLEDVDAAQAALAAAQKGGTA